VSQLYLVQLSAVEKLVAGGKLLATENSRRVRLTGHAGELFANRSRLETQK
jgi:hypothetical protein